jgi:DNA-binding CsgD family transcriptional regulator
MCIGREVERAEIDRFLSQLCRGLRVLLVEGDAGIGKTTLLVDGVDKALELGITVLSACPAESELPLEFAGLADLLDAVPAVAIDGLPPPQRRAIRQAVLRAEDQSRATDLRSAATAMFTLFRTLARRQPLAIIVDDLQWLDAPSARVLSFALRRLQLEPVGLLAAVRTDWSADPPWLATDNVPAERVERLTVGPLSLMAIRDVLATRTTLRPSRSLLLRLYETSGGNPLFALELARAAAGVRLGSQDGLDVPDSLRRLLAGRITGLPPETRDVLLVSSLAAEPELPVISAAVGKPESAHADLQVAIQAGLLLNAGGRIAFVHPMMRSVVIGQASAAERRSVHRRLAAVARGAEARARHLALGAEGPDEVVAGELEAAARMAARRGACDMAGNLAELAVALTPLGLSEHQRHRTVLAAEQRFEASEPGHACALLEEVIDAEPPGPRRAELKRRLARYRVFCGEPLASWTASLVRALDDVGDDLAVRAVIMMDQATAAIYSGSFPAAIRSAELVQELAVRTENKPLEAQCRAGLALATFLQGHGVRHDLIARALAGPEQPVRLSIELRPEVAIGHILHWTDDLDGARVLYQRVYAQARQEGVQTGLPLLFWAQAENEGWAGNWRRAEQLAAEGYSLAEDSGSLGGIAFMAASRGLLHAYRGRVDAGRNDAAFAVAIAGHLGMPMLAAIAAQAFGIAALSAGDPVRAHEQLDPFAAELLAAGIAEPALCRFIPDEIEALACLGDLGAAEALLIPFEVRSAELGRRWGVTVARRCRGLLLAAQGDLPGAAEAIDSAVAMHEHLTMPFEKARTLLAAGEIHRRARHKRQAAELLRSALTIFTELGAPLWRQRVLDELTRSGSTRVASPGNGQVLTAAEQRVADLVAAGHTNPEIAGRLFMGQRTVEAHLSRVFRKLGVRSRTELCRALMSPLPGPHPHAGREDMRALRICRDVVRA